MDELALLTEARAVVSNGWTRGALCENGCYCALGAMCVAAGINTMESQHVRGPVAELEELHGDAVMTLAYAVKDAVPYPTRALYSTEEAVSQIVDFNDLFCTVPSQVIEVFDSAIAAAEKTKAREAAQRMIDAATVVWNES